MKIVKYLIFLIFNHYYKDGNYKEEDAPYFTTTLSIMIYEGIIFYIGIDFTRNYVDISSFTNLLDSAKGIVYGRAMVIFALLYPLNHYYLLKKNNLDHIYNEFKNASINTKRNRIIGHTLILLYLPIIMALIVLLKS
ncbi:MAG: hypothetical protein U0X71_09390 [Sphingobacteriaceae bacterium]|jgi:glucose uptake protein GlcU